MTTVNRNASPKPPGTIGTDRASWRDAVIAYIRTEASPVDKFSHQPRVYRLATRIGAEIPHDDDILFAAAWLHDIGVFVGHRPEEPEALKRWDNVAYACGLVPELLARFGFPPEKTAAVVETIHGHLPHRDPATVEGKILRDADILEQLGSVGILRNVSKVGRDTRYATYSDIIPVLSNAVETLPGLLRFPEAQRMATGRVRLLQAFLAAIDEETGEAPL